MLSAAADPSPWLAVFGRAHPLLLHAPFGLTAAIAVLEFGALLRRRPPPRGAVLALCWFAVPCVALTVASGLVLAGEPGYGGDVLGQHKLAGFAFAGLTVLCALLALLPNRLPLRLALVLAGGAMLPTGHLGGTLSHGEAFLTEPLQKAIPADASEFVRVIQPLLARSCVKCHNPRKRRGELDLSTIDGIKAGGESGRVVVPGKPADSDLLQLCLLSEADDEVMPPAGKRPRPSQQDLETLARWIRDGAKFD